MGLYDRVLVPTDGSAETRRAVEHAVSLAAEHDATLHAVYVVNTATFASLSAETTTEGVSDLLAAEGEDAIDAVADVAADSDVPVERVLLNGTPSREIVRYAEDNDIDLIVMGTHGRGGIDRLLLGSVAEKVVRSSHVPVLTVHVED
ncbi:universal stress protein [Salarchaeum sp. JOR-1]|uniref:universal stress protein n=1 Tax=Salarchaeum sp. JOR-1 TaxID=2599399 RepID=UPI001198561D|nr:universal stress protein [Salarchaeum sp. JOR-1]QDX41713.1 universal stress protein [Salarchaeum sp. JOR-1]